MIENIEGGVSGTEEGCVENKLGCVVSGSHKIDSKLFCRTNGENISVDFEP